MQDDKLQRLHDTLALLRPKGKTGGLGRGGGGTTKRKNDGLPDNPLYARFVRAGDGFSKVKKFKGSDDEDDGDDKGEDDSGDESDDPLRRGSTAAFGGGGGGGLFSDDDDDSDGGLFG